MRSGWNEAENSFLFEVRILERNYDLTDPQRTGLISSMRWRRKLLKFEDEIERNNYTGGSSQAVSHSGYDMLRKLVNKLALTG